MYTSQASPERIPRPCIVSYTPHIAISRFYNLLCRLTVISQLNLRTSRIILNSGVSIVGQNMSVLDGTI